MIRKVTSKSIEERDKIISERVELGHWEMDIVEGKKGDKGYLLVLTYIKTKKEIITKLKDKSTFSVVKELKKIIRRDKYIFNTITTDNGVEFMDSEGIEKLGVEHFMYIVIVHGKG